MNNSQPVILPASPGDSTTVTTPSTPLNPFNVAPNLNQGAILQGPKAVTVKSRHTDPSSHSKITVTNAFTPKEKKAADSFCNYLDDDESMQKRRSRRLKSQSHPYKYAKKGESEK